MEGQESAEENVDLQETERERKWCNRRIKTIINFGAS
jgi:hypothetical protein